MYVRFALSILLACPTLAVGANEAALDAINAVRLNASCVAGPAPAPLRANTALDRAARALAAASAAVESKSLDEVLLAAGYRATRSMVIQVTGVPAGAPLARYIEKRFCDALASHDWLEVGLHQAFAGERARTWIILAMPFSPPRAESMGRVGERVLRLVNAARAQARSCGGKPFPAAAPLRWSDKLADMGLKHSADMAEHSYFSHSGRDGSNPASRATRNGYRWRSVGENIAGGPTTPEAAVQGWIDSPAHCANLMGAQFTEMGVAFATNPKSRMGIYWTQVFGRPW